MFEIEQATLLAWAAEMGAESVTLGVSVADRDEPRYDVEVMLPGMWWYEHPIRAYGFSIEAAYDAATSLVRGRKVAVRDGTVSK